MALNVDAFRTQVRRMKELNNYQGINYVLLKIAMELSDKLKPNMSAAQHKMQKLRFLRFAELWKIALEETMPELDIWEVFFQNGTSKLVNP